jgi:hypothetical protein
VNVWAWLGVAAIGAYTAVSLAALGALVWAFRLANKQLLK